MTTLDPARFSCSIAITYQPWLLRYHRASILLTLRRVYLSFCPLVSRQVGMGSAAQHGGDPFLDVEPHDPPPYSHMDSLAKFHNVEEVKEPCIVALHVRRGDACVNGGRSCFDYPLYWRGAMDLKRMHNLNSMVLVTDADDFPFQEFNSSFRVYSSSKDKSKYNVMHMANESFTFYDCARI
jgi:hypothetical protein